MGVQRVVNPLAGGETEGDRAPPEKQYSERSYAVLPQHKSCPGLTGKLSIISNRETLL